MPAERVSMRKIRDVLRLTHALGMSRRLVGEATGIGKTAVGEYVRRAAMAGLSWPILDKIDDAGQHCVAVLAAFALLDHHPGAVDIRNLERGDFGQP
jgi:hypothetical protein